MPDHVWTRFFSYANLLLIWFHYSKTNSYLFFWPKRTPKKGILYVISIFPASPEVDCAEFSVEKKTLFRHVCFNDKSQQCHGKCFNFLYVQIVQLVRCFSMCEEEILN
eukprot:TRINITY_DN54803_c0_g1_i1.p1 TRINITY_DN54803_c0_g1~~TRINITY_DN54803_c0_g1_i1.p1  ORF type:complete len:108 (+),score=9.51 TRINITY_DN54803_c0_g1_i1:17-340(+)